NRSRVAAV
ncbi:hypothetical protein KIPB_013536, partial [Kipferlia bialata]